MDQASGNSPDEAAVTKAIASLAEQFDTVQIFVSRYEGGDDGGTVHVCKGAGNYYARYGQAKEWIVKEEQHSRLGVKRSEEDA